MNWENFKEIWSGKLLTFEPTEFFMENKKYQRNFKFIIDIIWRHKKYIIKLSIISAIISTIGIFTAKFYQYLIDDVMPGNNLGLLLKLILVTSGMYLFTVAMSWIKLKISINFNKKLDKELVINIYNRMINLPMSFLSTRTSGELATRFSDGDQLRSTVTDFSLDFVIEVIYAIIAFITLLCAGSWQIIVIAIFIEEGNILIQKIFQPKMIERNKEEMKANSDVYSFVNASFAASETIKNYNSEKLMQENMEEKYAKYQNKIYKNQKFNQIQSSIMSTFSDINDLFIMSVLGLLVMQGRISMGNFVYFYTLVNYISGPIEYLSRVKEQIYQTTAVLERLDDVFRTTTEDELDKDKTNINGKIEKIEFKNVTFQYGLKKPVLEDISFKVHQGESIGIIGESGSGKTTLVKLILKFFDINEGQILINDKDINNYKSSSIRKKIAYVSQNDFWFQDTIFNNLIIGKKEATREEVERVLKLVKMTEFIENKEYGLDTVLEEGALNISSGERQRLSIAKALITNPDVLILDESTSNLDANTEEFIVNSLTAEKNIIKIVIAHRLNTLSRCNKVISIENGTIVENGTPQELLSQKGMFFNLWNIQNEALKLKK